MISSLVQYTNDAAGLEKTLRLIQGFCAIAAGFLDSPFDAAPWVAAKKQLALTRRFFRLLKWYPCWQNALTTTNSTILPPLAKMLEVMKFSILGLYFFLEMFTITNVMGVTHFTWGPFMQQQADKCWFYAICLSVFSALYQLYFMAPVTAPTKASREPPKEEKKSEKTSNKASPGLPPKTAISSNERAAVHAQIIIDSCDLMLPGSALGWIPAGNLLIGCTMTISSSLAGYKIGQRVFAAAGGV